MGAVCGKVCSHLGTAIAEAVEAQVEAGDAAPRDRLAKLRHALPVRAGLKGPGGPRGSSRGWAA